MTMVASFRAPLRVDEIPEATSFAYFPSWVTLSMEQSCGSPRTPVMAELHFNGAAAKKRQIIALLRRYLHLSSTKYCNDTEILLH